MAEPDNRLISLYRTNYQLESESLCNRLVANGVPAISRWSGMAPFAMRAPAIDLTTAEVAISFADLDMALEVLKDNREMLAEMFAQTPLSKEQLGVLRAYDFLFHRPFCAALPLLGPLIFFILSVKWAFANAERMALALVVLLIIPAVLLVLLLRWTGRSVVYLLHSAGRPAHQ